MKTLADRLWSKIDVRGPSECWPWTGALSDGYGVVRTGGRGSAMTGAHRAAYEDTHGPIPPGLQLDHLCRNPPCCNPAHLEPVTAGENVLRSPIAPAAVNARKTSCVNGHPLSGDNLYMHGGHRMCRTCRREANHRWIERNTA